MIRVYMWPHESTASHAFVFSNPFYYIVIETPDVWQDSVTNYHGIASSCKLKIAADTSLNRIQDRETLSLGTNRWTF